MARTLPPDVAARIAAFTPDRCTLAALARTSRAFQEPAEARLYAALDLAHHPATLPLLAALASTPRTAARVHSLSLSVSVARAAQVYIDGGREAGEAYQQDVRAALASARYWAVVRAALARCTALQLLQLGVPAHAHADVLLPPRPPSDDVGELNPSPGPGLRVAGEARLSIVWGPPVAQFLAAQDALEALTLDFKSPSSSPDAAAADAEDADAYALLPPTALPALRVYEGPLRLALRLTRAPLTHLKAPWPALNLGSGRSLGLNALAHFTNLRSLCLTNLPVHMDAVDAVATIARACPRLLYLAHVPLPVEHAERAHLLAALTPLRHLGALELDAHHWSPPPRAAHQRALAAEVRVALSSGSGFSSGSGSAGTAGGRSGLGPGPGPGSGGAGADALRYIFFSLRSERWVWTWAPEGVAPRPSPSPSPASTAAAPSSRSRSAAKAKGRDLVEMDSDSRRSSFEPIDEVDVEHAYTGSQPSSPGHAAHAPASYVGIEGWTHTWHEATPADVYDATTWRTLV